MRTLPKKLLVFGLLAALFSLGTIACGGGEEERKEEDETVAEGPDQAEAREVVLYQYRFNPNQLTIPKGTEVTFVNKDPDRHNVSIPALNLDENIPAGESVSHTFETTGEFAVSNRFSSSPMKMEIVVE